MAFDFKKEYCRPNEVGSLDVMIFLCYTLTNMTDIVI